MDALWLAITNLGRDEVFIVVLVLYTLLVSPRGGRNLGVMFALCYLTNTALKFGLNLPRPFTDHPELASAAAKATGPGPGLPSGHTQMGATLWLGLAAQQRRGWLWGLAAGVVALLAVSRLVLHVHFPSDVLVGLVLGTLFALGATLPLSTAGSGRWLPALALLLLSALLPAYTPREVPVGLGLLAGFWALQPQFVPPRTWGGRLLVGVLGLALVLLVYFALGALPHAVKDLNAVRALRYALLVLWAGQGVPLLLRRWLPAAPVAATPQPQKARA